MQFFKPSFLFLYFLRRKKENLFNKIVNKQKRATETTKNKLP